MKLVYLISTRNKGKDPNLYFINFKDKKGSIEIAKEMVNDITILYELDEDINTKFKEIYRKEL